MDQVSKDRITKLNQEEILIRNEIKVLETKLDMIGEEKWKIYAKRKIDSDEIECAYCGYFASKKENPGEAEVYNATIKSGRRYYCGNCSE